MEISAVIVNYNGFPFLRECLLPLFQQSVGDIEVILVDNSSTDQSVSLVEGEFEDQIRNGLLKIVRLDSNAGYAGGANSGFRAATGRYVACLNNDVFVPVDFAEKMVDPLESVPGAVAVGCILDTRGSQIRYASAFFRKGYVQQPGAELVSRRVYCLAPSGAAAFYNKEKILEAGGYDETFVSDWEDHDLGYRLNVLGHRCIHNPSVMVRHLGGQSFGGVGYRRFRRVARNMLLTYYKNCERLNLWKTPASLLVTGFGSLETGRRRREHRGLHPSDRITAAIKGACDFLKVLPSYRKIRSRIQRSRRSSDLEICHLTSGNTEW
jgi:GT2 family glycosyltransferase